MRRSGPNRRFQCRLQIGNQIVGMFQPDRKPDQPFGDARPFARICRQPGMGGRGRLSDQRFRATKTDRQLEQLQPVDHTERQRPIIIDEHRKGRTGAGALPIIDRAFCRADRMVRVQHLAGQNVLRGQLCRHFRATFRRPLHPQGQGFHRPRQHPTGMRVKLKAKGAAALPDRLDQIGPACHTARYQIAMAPDIFRQRIDTDIDPQLDRPLA